MRFAVDSNILARSIHKGDAMQQVAQTAVDWLFVNGEIVCVLAQNLYEFWVVATRPIEANGLGLSFIEAQTHLLEFEHLFSVQLETADIYTEWRQLVTQHAVLGKPAHDARIVAAMKVHGISHLITFNVGDFKRFPGIMTAISPEDVLQMDLAPEKSPESED